MSALNLDWTLIIFVSSAITESYFTNKVYWWDFIWVIEKKWKLYQDVDQKSKLCTCLKRAIYACPWKQLFWNKFTKFPQNIRGRVTFALWGLDFASGLSEI